jgi:hypothetical protein
MGESEDTLGEDERKGNVEEGVGGNFGSLDQRWDTSYEIVC